MMIAGDGSHPERIVRVCPPTPTGCDLPAGRYIPVDLGGARVVWQPANNRYVNEPTLVRAADGTWHVFANGAEGEGGPWVEHQLLHASSPSLEGPWTEHADILSTRDPNTVETTYWAPFVMRDDTNYRIFYYAALQGSREALRSATSPDLGGWTRDPAELPGGRDAMLLRLSGGRDLLYTVSTERESDGAHDSIVVYEGRALTGWGPRRVAVRNPSVCPGQCWGFYESPYVVELGGAYYLFVTYADTDAVNYERTIVFRSQDPLSFAPEPITQLQGHGGELHVEGQQMFMTRGGWPSRIGDRRGLSIVPIGWERVE